MGEWLLSRRDRLIVARHEYVFSEAVCGPKGLAVWTFENRFSLRPGGTCDIPAPEEPSQRNNGVPKIRPQLPFVIFASSCANFLGLLLSPTLQIQASLGRSSTGSRNPAINRRATVQVLQLLLWKSLSPMGSVHPSRWDVAIFFMIPGTSCLATIVLSLRDKNLSPIEAPRNYLNAY